MTADISSALLPVTHKYAKRTALEICTHEILITFLLSARCFVSPSLSTCRLHTV
jgi:hypothetical protein